MEVIEPQDGAIPVLQEKVKISSPFDLILQLSSECSILTALRTGDNVGGPPGDDGDDSTDAAFASGEVEMFITIDGRVVPITSQDNSPPGPGTQGDPGRVVFCNREYQRTVQDSEDQGSMDPDDGTDTTDDYIRTRTANAFNWLALDVGFNYDDQCTVADTAGCFEQTAANGNNIVEIIVYADYERKPTRCAGLVAPEPEDACAEAFVGRRTLIAEPTNASNHEWVHPTDESTP